MKMARLYSFVMVPFLLVSLLAGCLNRDNGQDLSVTNGTAGQTNSSGIPEPLTMPIVKTPLKLRYFATLDGKVAATLNNYNEIACYKKMEELSGINIEWLHPPAGQGNEQFNLMIASMDLPDMMFYDWPAVAGGPAKAIEDGVIIKLNDSVQKYAPNLSKVLKSNPLVYKQAVLDDKSLYMFPMLRIRKDEPAWFKNPGFIIRKDWLDKLNLKTPKTLDELYTVLKVFRDKDPNGNGIKDEIPFVSNKDGGLKNLAGAFGILSGLYQNNGKIKYGPMEPAYKDYLTMLNNWYVEGLIDPGFAATDAKGVDTKITSNKAGFFFGLLASNLGRYLDLVKPNNPEFDLLPLPWPTGPAGKPYATHQDYIDGMFPGNGTAITTANKHVKETVKWLDYAYSEQGNLLFNFGIEGESYVMKNGVPTYTDAIMKNPNGYSMDQALSRYCTAIFPAASMKDEQYYIQSALALPQQKATQNKDSWGGGDNSLLIPTTTFTAEEAALYASIMSEVNTYVNDMHTKFVTGKEPIGNYDKYVQHLKELNIEEAIKMKQAALDRFYKR